MRRKKILLFLIIALVLAAFILAVGCDNDENKRELTIQYNEDSKVVTMQAPWAEYISFTMYYGTDASGQKIIAIDKIYPQNAVISIESYLQKYGYGDYFLVSTAIDNKGFSVERTLSFQIKPLPYDDGGDDDNKQDIPTEDGKPVEGKLKSVYYFQKGSDEDLKIKLFNPSRVESLDSFMDLNFAWNYDSEDKLLSIKAAYINTLSLGAKIPLEITYGDGGSDSIYMQVADSVPMDIVKGGLKDSNIYSENNNGIIKLTPIIGFDLYLGKDGEIAQSGAYVNAVVIDGVKLLQSEYSLSNKYTKITFSHTTEKILKLSHGLHFVEVYTANGRSEAWIYLRKGVENYPQGVKIDFDSDFPNISIRWSMLRDDAQAFAVHIGDKIYSDSEYPELFSGNSFDATGKINYLDKVKVAATFDNKTYLSLDDETLKINLQSSVIQSYLSYGKSFEFLGVNNNFYIRNFDEFKDMIFYSLLNYSQLDDCVSSAKYQKTLKFYADTTFLTSVKEVESNFDNALKYFNEAVKETHEIKAGYDGVYELNFTVKSTCIPDDSGREPVSTNVKENSYNNWHYSLTGRQEGYDGFAVNSYKKTASVKYSEELYMALEREIRPIPQSGSDAEKIYNSAKSILTRIIDDNMSDYQKVHAMADWLSSNVAYNWSLDEEVGKVSSTSEEYNKFYAYSEFYLEGVFLNRLAVCNGYAKAMSLMCGIEGIKCYKVKGGSGRSSGTIGNYPQHAWNKIEIDGKWYVVDTTWANERYSDGKDTFEVLKHNTLFMSERESGNGAGGAHYEMYTGMYTGRYAGESYDIFANTFFKYGGNMHDMVIDSAEELETLLLYMIENKASAMLNSSYITVDVRCSNTALEGYLKQLRAQESNVFENFSYSIKYNENTYGNMTGIVMKRL